MKRHLSRLSDLGATFEIYWLEVRKVSILVKTRHVRAPLTVISKVNKVELMKYTQWAIKQESCD